MIKQREDIKVLISDTAPLYPPLWGGPKRIWNLFANFSQDLFDITYVGVDFDLATKGKKYSFNRIRNNFREMSCAYPPHYYCWYAYPPSYYFWQMMEKKAIRNSLLNIFAYFYMHTNWHFRYILNSQKADVLVCSHPWSYLTMRKNKGQIFIYDAHNCEYLLTKQILKKHKSKGLILREVRKIEANVCKRSDLILVCSEKEKQDFVDIYKVCPERVYVFPNGAYVNPPVSVREKEEARGELGIMPAEKIVVFVGTHYKPNVDAARLIMDFIAPELKDFRFIIVGTVIRDFVTDRIPDNINFLGGVSDQKLSLALKSSDIAINPVDSGSGVNMKMLDYMSYGLPVVTTECGARGIETPGRCPMIISDIDKFVDNIRMLDDNKVLYKQMSEDGRNLIAQRYNWKVIGKKLQKIIIERLR